MVGAMGSQETCLHRSAAKKIKLAGKRATRLPHFHRLWQLFANIGADGTFFWHLLPKPYSGTSEKIHNFATKVGYFARKVSENASLIW